MFGKGIRKNSPAVHSPAFFGPQVDASAGSDAGPAILLISKSEAAQSRQHEQNLSRNGFIRIDWFRSHDVFPRTGICRSWS
jgi:hypothetical protein